MQHKVLPRLSHASIFSFSEQSANLLHQAYVQPVYALALGSDWQMAWTCEEERRGDKEKREGNGLHLRKDSTGEELDLGNRFHEQEVVANLRLCHGRSKGDAAAAGNRCWSAQWIRKGRERGCN